MIYCFFLNVHRPFHSDILGIGFIIQAFVLKAFGVLKLQARAWDSGSEGFGR